MSNERLDARRLAALRDHIKKQYLKWDKKLDFKGNPLKERHFIVQMTEVMRRGGLLHGSDSDSKVIEDIVRAVKEDQLPDLPEEERKELFRPEPDEAAFREQLTRDLSLPQRTIQKIRDTNKIRAGIKIGPLVIKKSRPQFDEEMIVKLTEYGARSYILETCEFLEQGGFRSEEKPAVVEALHNAMKYIASGVEEFIVQDENAYREITQTKSVPAKPQYDQYVRVNPIDTKIVFEGIGKATTDCSLGHPAIIADFMKIVHIGHTDLRDNDIDLINEVVLPFRITAEGDIGELDRELAVFGLAYIEDEGCYKKMPYLEP